ncbi:MAG: PIN domain-containing protein [Akkermansiaceae bacterium]|nr:PIN domain-containing protein [Akkermansiaceae bacterium]
MKRFLPDVNTLLALLDPMHVHHEAAHRWYASQSPLRLILCSHVENGVIRVASQPKYPNCLGTSSRVRDALRKFAKKVNTASCGKDVSLLDDEILLQSGLLTPSRVSDLYLLALAAANDARFATFDTHISAKAVAGGSAALEIIPIF